MWFQTFGELVAIREARDRLDDVEVTVEFERAVRLPY